MLVYDVNKSELAILLTKEKKGITQEDILSVIKVDCFDTLKGETTTFLTKEDSVGVIKEDLYTYVKSGPYVRYVCKGKRDILDLDKHMLKMFIRNYQDDEEFVILMMCMNAEKINNILQNVSERLISDRNRLLAIYRQRTTSNMGNVVRMFEADTYAVDKAVEQLSQEAKQVYYSKEYSFEIEVIDEGTYLRYKVFVDDAIVENAKVVCKRQAKFALLSIERRLTLKKLDNWIVNYPKLRDEVLKTCLEKRAEREEIPSDVIQKVLEEIEHRKILDEMFRRNTESNDYLYIYDLMLILAGNNESIYSYVENPFDSTKTRLVKWVSLLRDMPPSSMKILKEINDYLPEQLEVMAYCVKRGFRLDDYLPNPYLVPTSKLMHVCCIVAQKINDDNLMEFIKEIDLYETNQIKSISTYIQDGVDLTRYLNKLYLYPVSGLKAIKKMIDRGMHISKNFPSNMSSEYYVLLTECIDFGLDYDLVVENKHKSILQLKYALVAKQVGEEVYKEILSAETTLEAKKVFQKVCNERYAEVIQCKWFRDVRMDMDINWRQNALPTIEEFVIKIAGIYFERYTDNMNEGTFDFFKVEVSVLTEGFDYKAYVKNNIRAINEYVIEHVSKLKGFQKKEIPIQFFEISRVQIGRDGILEYTFALKELPEVKK